MPMSAAGHAERMDSVYRFQRHLYDATRKYYLLGRDRMIARLQPGPGAKVVDLGCGTGRNLILAARRYPEARYYGFDISAEMLATARANVEKAGLSHRIMLARGDACAVDLQAMFGIESADIAYFSYMLSMVPDWRHAIAEGARILAPGGRLHIVDFGQQEGLPDWFRSMLFGWLARFHVVARGKLRETLEAEAVRVGAVMHFQPLYRGYAWSAELTKRD